MNMMDSLPTYTLALPALLVVGAWLLSKILRFSMWATLLVGCAPFILPYLDLPFSKEFLDSNPLYLIGAGWALLFCFALGRAIVSPALGGESGRSPAGVARAAYGVVLGVALLVVALLVSKPEIMEATFPGWKGSAGLVLLCASLLSMSLWLARVLKAAIVFSLWSVVSLVLASELFLNKLPYDVVREDLRHLEPLASRFGLKDALKEVETFSVPSAEGTASISDKIKAYVLGVSPNTGFLYPKERSFAHALQGVLERQGVSAEVKDATAFDASSVQLKEIALTKVAPTKPDLVVIMGWGSDAVRGRNSFGIPGVSEVAAKTYVDGVRELHKYPFAADVVESVLYRYGSQLVSESVSARPLEDLPYRVSPEEYKDLLRATVQGLHETGAQVVLIPEPVSSGSEAPYRNAMSEIASETQSSFLPVDELLQASGEETNGRLYARGRLLSQVGYERVAELLSASVSAKLRPANPPDSASSAAEGNASGISSTLQMIGDDVDAVIREEAVFLVDPAQVRGDLIFRLKIAEQGTRFYRVVFSVNGEFVADRRLDSREETRVRFSLPDTAKKFSVVELSLKTIASPPPNEDLIGTTDQFAPTPLQVSSDRAGLSMVKIGKRAYFARSRGVGSVAVSVDLRSGDVLNVIRTEDASELNRWVMSQPWGSIVTASILLDTQNSLTALKPALKFIGASNVSPSEHGGFAVIGVTGTKKGEASIQTPSEGAASLSIGSDILKAYSKFTLFDVSTGAGDGVKNIHRQVAQQTSQTVEAASRSQTPDSGVPVEAATTSAERAEAP